MIANTQATQHLGATGVLVDAPDRGLLTRRTERISRWRMLAACYLSSRTRWA